MRRVSTYVHAFFSQIYNQQQARIDTTMQENLTCSSRLDDQQSSGKKINKRRESQRQEEEETESVLLV